MAKPPHSSAKHDGKTAKELKAGESVAEAIKSESPKVKNTRHFNSRG